MYVRGSPWKGRTYQYYTCFTHQSATMAFQVIWRNDHALERPCSHMSKLGRSVSVVTVTGMHAVYVLNATDRSRQYTYLGAPHHRQPCHLQLQELLPAAHIFQKRAFVANPVLLPFLRYKMLRTSRPSNQPLCHPLVRTRRCSRSRSP